MNRQTPSRIDWLSGLTTRELVIYLMELRRAADKQPGLASEVNHACDVLREELLRREWSVPASR